MKGSLVILAFFILGLFFGYFHFLPTEVADSSVSFAALCALIFCVGVSIGCDSEVLHTLRHTSPRLLLLPLCTLGGTLAGCLAVSLLHDSVIFALKLLLAAGRPSYYTETILPSVLLSMILMPPVYLLVKAVHKTGGSYDL